jgi:hypothetical protein
VNSGDDGELRQQRRARECEEMRVSSGRGGRKKRASSPFYREREGIGRGGRRSIKEAITASVLNESNGGREKRKSSLSINARDEQTTSALCHGASVLGVRGRRLVEASRRGECRGARPGLRLGAGAGVRWARGGLRRGGVGAWCLAGWVQARSCPRVGAGRCRAGAQPRLPGRVLGAGKRVGERREMRGERERVGEGEEGHGRRRLGASQARARVRVWVAGPLVGELGLGSLFF